MDTKYTLLLAAVFLSCVGIVLAVWRNRRGDGTTALTLAFFAGLCFAAAFAFSFP